jgi:hypothetical protein
MEVCVSLVVGPLVADEFTFPTLSLAKGDSKMTIRKRSKKMCAVAICVGLALSQVLARAGHEDQVGHIQLRQASTEVVRPIQRSRLHMLASLSEFANRLILPSELPNYDWLQAGNDAEEPPTLELFSTDADSGAVGLGDGQDWTSVLRLTKTTKKLLKLTKKTKERAKEATKYTWTITLTPEEADNTDEDENEREEEEDKANQMVLDNQAQLASEEEQLLQQMVEEAASELTIYETQDDGVAFNRNDATQRLAEVRRQMMLNFELDSAVLASF